MRVLILDYLHRTWAEISLSALENNFKEIKRRAKGAKIMAVVKANAYGHGADIVAPFLEKLGADAFAVSNIDEAISLRKCGITAPVLILGYTPANLAETLSANNISQCVYSLEYARHLSDCASKADADINIHLKLDTGMSRLGFDFRGDCDCEAQDLLLAAKLPHLNTEGVFTHFAAADSDDGGCVKFTEAQHERFLKGVDFLRENGICPEYIHCDNSAAICREKYTFNTVRPGIILYGLSPDRDFDPDMKLIPVMTLKSVVSFVKTVKKGTPVSYGMTYTAPRDMKIATVAAGYADGYPRKLSNTGELLVCGRRVKVTGRVCMDQLMIDVNGIGDIKTGDEVILFGKDLSVDEIAEKCGTISYETVCGIAPRVPRIAVE